MTRRRGGRPAAFVLAVLLGTGATVLPVLAGAAHGAEASDPPAAPDDLAVEDDASAIDYSGDPEAESAHVAAEDDRLTEVRTVGTAAAWSQTPLKSPYRLVAGSGYTLVLTARSEPYTVADLTVLAPQTFVRRPDGSYLLSEHLVVSAGATLNLTEPGGLTLLLASDAEGFVSIVNYGGRLNIAGDESDPAVVKSFDRSSERVDRLTDDGRAYLRSIGGQVSVAQAELSHLGFWSGRTGGLSLTGTDRPDSGALYDLADSLKVGPAAKDPEVDTDKNSAIGDVLPAGELPVPTVDVDSPTYSYVSAAITGTTVAHNAFGLFVSGANGLDVRSSSFDENLVSGVVLHRFVVNAVLERAVARHNRRDGVLLARATTGIVLSELLAADNGRNGVTISGLPLATGPSATGTSIGSYGNNTISNSEIARNGRYGVEVIGGTNIGVLANAVDANEMGIVVRDVARKVSIVGNKVSGSRSQGIALRDGVVAAGVTGNIVTGGTTSVYVRDAEARIESNTLRDAEQHAASFVGDVGSSVMSANTVTGRGPSAIESERARDLERGDWVNDTTGWADTTPFVVTLKRFAQPLTVLWILLGALLLFTALRGARSRQSRRHPYADKAPVSDGAPTAPDRETVGAGRGS
ncbi:right-handed parallel beta-helix repeat-containing protein [Nocardioides sp. W7]|uniref:right-handed parallel beta-helix repeat-containing protein n=1 Tax=Nocardioides sp. W7 TaxID=2931390 RepID=UPI001FD02CD0|nr:right-handed parallel beta-helix repeat-containing protein [Nocardioides sp. W7]